jgi:hypothetical protein
MEIITKNTDTLPGLVSTFKELDNRGKKILFRGQTDYQDSLVPGIYRNILEKLDPPFKDVDDPLWLGEMERDAYRDFGDKSKGLIPGKDRHYDQWDLLFIAQHYGLPTRLIDWTDDFFVATYFAVANEDGKDGHIWGINVTDFPHPKQLGRLSNNGAFRLDAIKASLNTQDLSFFVPQSRSVAGGSQPRSSLPSDQSKDPSRSGFMTFLFPPYLDGRIRNQKGLFSIYLSQDGYDLVPDHAEYIRNLERIYHLELLTKIVIPSHSKWEIKKDLRSLGKDPSTIYPDLIGLISHLKDERRSTIERYVERRKKRKP